MAELQDEIIRYEKEVQNRKDADARYRRETFWFYAIFWSSLSTIPIGFITALCGAFVVGMVFICIGIGSMLLMVLGALFAL